MLGLQLRTHFKGHTSPVRVAGDAVWPFRLDLLDTVNIVGSHTLDAVQGSSWKREADKM